MKQQEVFKKIGGIIKELNEQYEYLKTVDGALNDLELELFLANSHFLTDHMIILTKLNAQLAAQQAVEKEPKTEELPAERQPAIAEEPKYFEPLVQPVSPMGKTDAVFSDTDRDSPEPQIDLASNEDTYSFMTEEPETIRHELILDDADWDDEDELEEKPEEPVYVSPQYTKPAAEVKNEEKPVEEKPAVHSVKEEVLTINEKMLAQLGEKSGLAEQLHAQAIGDLKSAISLNDKLLYIKDLFNGYSLAYSEAIEILNRFTSFDEAELFLKKNYFVKNNWEAKPDTTGKFYALLKRRYA